VALVLPDLVRVIIPDRDAIDFEAARSLGLQSTQDEDARKLLWNDLAFRILHRR